MEVNLVEVFHKYYSMITASTSDLLSLVLSCATLVSDMVIMILETSDAVDMLILQLILSVIRFLKWQVSCLLRKLISQSRQGIIWSSPKSFTVLWKEIFLIMEENLPLVIRSLLLTLSWLRILETIQITLNFRLLKKCKEYQLRHRCSKDTARLYVILFHT